MTASPPGPRRSLTALRAAVRECRRCHLYKCATHAVSGAGAKSSRIMFIGEQPGDKEDLVGRPFVGPAGRLLDAGMEAAGIPRDAAYLTNVVKHFKFTPRGKRRIHAKPNRTEVEACKPWLGEELAIVAPDIVVLLGATAAQALLGSKFRVTQSRGQLIQTDLAPCTLATFHPSAVLRAPTEEARATARSLFFSDLATVGNLYANHARRLRRAA